MTRWRQRAVNRMMVAVVCRGWGKNKVCNLHIAVQRVSGGFFSAYMGTSWELVRLAKLRHDFSHQLTPKMNKGVAVPSSAVSFSYLCHQAE